MQKSYLFLQGPHGPFFKELATELENQGAKVLRVNFNGGDWIDWHGKKFLNFTGTQQQWFRYVSRLYRRHQITDLVVYGDCRSLHEIAIRQAGATDIRVHVFEEGYIRPNWITLEQNGVNGHSALLNDKQRLTSLLDSMVPHEESVDTVKVGPSTRWILWYCLRYYLFKSVLAASFRHYIRHRPYRPHQELLLWLGNLIHMPLLYTRSKRRRKRLRLSGQPFYLVCLQLDSDAQLKVHSPYLSMANIINEVLRSFAEHAPKNSLLVFKKHPFDPGAIPYETLIRLEAYSLGIRERILFIHSGSLPELIQWSQGVVLMNSTVGTSALHHGKPTVVHGKAIYDLPGLTWQKGLTSFWKEASAPDMDLYRRFRALLFKETLVHGGFYTSHGRRFAIKGILRRLDSVQEQTPVKSASRKVVSLR
ncbi:MAG: capsular biosynthesis protein [Desulfuromonadales bacterium]|nr:capsular biosynthesis protein [Desulfuromonadales bacterium]MBN2791542.1 capsular biosynthesis protein [Desulfuromonadales bacterium]